MQILRNLLPAVPSSCVDEPPPTAFAQLLASSPLPAPGLADVDSSSESSSSSLEYADEPAQDRMQSDDWHGLYTPLGPRPLTDDLAVPDIPALDTSTSHAMTMAELFEQPYPGELDTHEDRQMGPPPPPVCDSVLLLGTDRLDSSWQAGPSATSFSALEDRVQTTRVSVDLLFPPVLYTRLSPSDAHADQCIG